MRTEPRCTTSGWVRDSVIVMKPWTSTDRTVWRTAAVLLWLSACAERAPVAAILVEDRAGLLSGAEETNVTRWHAALLDQYDIDYRVLTVDEAGDSNRLAHNHFEQARVGSLSGTGRGLLLVVDSERERVRLEVARELESVFVDSFVAFVEREQMAPYFAAGRVGDGIVAASELLVSRAEQAIETSELDERKVAASTAGAGAESAAESGTAMTGRLHALRPTRLRQARRSRQSRPILQPWPPTTHRPILTCIR